MRRSVHSLRARDATNPPPAPGPRLASRRVSGAPAGSIRGAMWARRRWRVADGRAHAAAAALLWKVARRGGAGRRARQAGRAGSHAPPAAEADGARRGLSSPSSTARRRRARLVDAGTIGEQERVARRLIDATASTGAWCSRRAAAGCTKPRSTSRSSTSGEPHPHPGRGRALAGAAQRELVDVSRLALPRAEDAAGRVRQLAGGPADRRSVRARAAVGAHVQIVGYKTRAPT